MVQKTFSIYSEEFLNCKLCIETGPNYIVCWCSNLETKKVKAFELFRFDEEAVNDFESLFTETKLHSRLLTASFETVICIWGNEKSVCIPAEFYDDETAIAIVKIMLGETDEVKLYHDTNGDCVTLAVLPERESGVYNINYNIAANIHKHHLLLKNSDRKTMDSSIHIVFYHTHFIIIIYKKGILQLIQHFKYKIAEDVLYTILNTCSLFELHINDTPVIVSGLIDTSSPLYGILHQYLHNFSFPYLDESLYDAKGFHDYPLHYFAPFCQCDV